MTGPRIMQLEQSIPSEEDPIDETPDELAAHSRTLRNSVISLAVFFGIIVALLRRAGEDDDQDGTLAFEDLRLDRLAHEAWRGERPLPLTRTEFLLLEMFLRHPRQVLTRSAIFEHVWGYDFGSTSNSLGVYMGYLRRKTESEDETRLLHTVRGVGYVLRGSSA